MHYNIYINYMVLQHFMTKNELLPFPTVIPENLFTYPNDNGGKE
jgi:hypothetical protein